MNRSAQHAEAASSLAVDVLVAGGGMAGLAAGAAAAQAGATVLVVEKQHAIGGSAAISSGNLWTARDFAELRGRIPRGDADLARLLAERIEDDIRWLEESRVWVGRAQDGTHLGWGRGRLFDIHGWLEWCARQVETGGHLVRDTRVAELIRDDDGAVIGARTRGPDGPMDVVARGTILATGGFQGDRGLRAQFIGRGADEMILRSNPGSVGDGFRLGLAAGASVSSALSSFYGHLMPSPLEEVSANQYLPLKQSHSNRSILLNRLGRRFVDESLGDEISNQAVLRQPEARAILLVDADVHRRWVVRRLSPGGEPVDTFGEAAAAGARYQRCADLDALLATLAAWGLPPANVMASLGNYARAAEGSSTAVLDAPVPAEPQPLRTPPFHALEVQPSITFTFGGLRIDDRARVLDRDNEPIPNLYAAGADAGGIYNIGYAGGLALALAFGRLAGLEAAASAR